VAPSWHFAAQDARLSLDGVVQVSTDQMVQVQYSEPDGSLHHCINSEVASIDLRVRTRMFPGAPWRPETTLTSKAGASLEFCGRAPDPRVKNMLISAASQKEAVTPGSVAS
jgi:hypothetical protein